MTATAEENEPCEMCAEAEAHPEVFWFKEACKDCQERYQKIEKEFRDSVGSTM